MVSMPGVIKLVRLEQTFRVLASQPTHECALANRGEANESTVYNP